MRVHGQHIENRRLHFDGLFPYRVRPSLELGASLTYTVGQPVADQASRPHYVSGAVAGWYELSKRTGVYVYTGYQHASGSTIDPYGNVVPATTSLGDSASCLSSAGRNQFMTKLGSLQQVLTLSCRPTGLSLSIVPECLDGAATPP
ncbi:hypothetical protein BN2476_680092 [Paraburkholderia piptadeniae]|uniref:Uncharacterized protein n=1 Tax=Paraburkholderia piptadeniae TaxID=1701573 RepID=A0A1N7SPK5_9BURK|nr:hypothetical protein BN2476_680092 [Paraburkholderia piptadeniae]